MMEKCSGKPAGGSLAVIRCYCLGNSPILTSGGIQTLVLHHAKPFVIFIRQAETMFQNVLISSEMGVGRI